MKVERVWIVQRPLRNDKWKNLVATFSLGAARNACVPNFKDRILDAVIVTDVGEADGIAMLQGIGLVSALVSLCRSLCPKASKPTRRPAKKAKRAK